MNDAVRKHTLQSGWDSWKTEMLKDAKKAKPYEPELAKPKKEHSTEPDTTDLDDDEMELLQRSALDTDVRKMKNP